MELFTKCDCFEMRFALQALCELEEENDDAGCVISDEGGVTFITDLKVTCPTCHGTGYRLTEQGKTLALLLKNAS